ncbi:MAG: ABC-F family ATP-binding cassette domain-containing protein [Clostridia bacterium]|nr:ABC-F family ATP-binding cassette domain-containing protein [Clostridia bacterium]
MNILSAENIYKSYSEKVLLDGISLGINEGEKIGVIGINGTGKSTLLKIIAGVEQPDRGSLIKGREVVIQYLPQNPVFEPGVTVLQHVFKGNSPMMVLLREYEDTLQKLNSDPSDMHVQKKLIDLSGKMDALDAWTVEKEAKSILTKLGIVDYEAVIDHLSGGQKKRIAMAGALISPAELLILDEPTNHIDNDTVDWLEKYLNKRKGALLMVTHDRYFLDRVANRMIELDQGRLFSYQANYSKFLELKAEREELEQSSERKRQSLFRKELEWILRGAKARSTKQKARIERFEKLQGESPVNLGQDIEIKAVSSRLGKKIIEVENIKKSFAGNPVVNDFSYILLRDDRIGIIGPNGAGKSTLLKMIAGKLIPDSGKLSMGETVKIGYFSQENEEMNEKLRVIEYIREEADCLNTEDGMLSASQMLETFLFPPSVQWTPIAKLSGGEKRRLYLLRILMGAPNILLMDEPTNDLDIQTLTILESYLDEFPGAVVVVSHDRYFLDKVATKIFSFEGKGMIKQYTGNYSDAYEELEKSRLERDEKSRQKEEGNRDIHTEGKKEKPLKFTYKEQREFEQIDEVIAGLEEELKEVNRKIDASSSNFEMLQDLLSQKELMEKNLEQAIERWAYLNEIAEKIEKDKKSKL